MKKSTAVFATLIALGVAGGMYFGVSKSEASATPEQEAKQAAITYLNALENRNVDEATKYVKDVRFPTPEALVEAYKSMFQSDPVTDYKIHSVKATDATHAVMDLEYISKELGNQRSDVKLQKFDDGWKVVFDQIRQTERSKKK